MNLPMGIQEASEYARSEKFITMFVSLIDPSDETDCWNWVGNLNPTGDRLVPLVTIGGRQYPAYKALYYFCTGLWPKYLRRACKNKFCVNVSHVEEYERDSVSHDQVRSLRLAWKSGTPIIRLAAQRGMARTTVHNIVHGYTYRNVA